MTPPGSLANEQHPGVSTDPQVLALRQVHRAAAELRRGTPVLLRGGDACLAVAAAETVGARGLAELAAAGLTPPVLLLAPVRAAAVLQRPVPHGAEEEGAVALRLPAALLAPEALRSLADPTAGKYRYPSSHGSTPRTAGYIRASGRLAGGPGRRQRRRCAVGSASAEPDYRPG